MWYNENMREFWTFREYTDAELKNVSVATLAWIGDAVYSLCAREFELRKGLAKPNQLHRLASGLVNAQAQSDALARILPHLDEEEAGVVRRAKNSPITTKSKNFGLAEYKRATGLEALVGHLYLSNKIDRLNEILALIWGENEVKE